MQFPSSEDTATVEAIHTLVELTELVEDTIALVADISGKLSSFGARSQGSQAELYDPIEASCLVKKKGISVKVIEILVVIG